MSKYEYKKIYMSNYWSLKENTLDYIRQDILSLLEVIDNFKNYLFIEHNLDVTKGLTLSRLALNKF
jgi:hypothetical protein